MIPDSDRGLGTAVILCYQPLTPADISLDIIVLFLSGANMKNKNYSTFKTFLSFRIALIAIKDDSLRIITPSPLWCVEQV